MNRRSFLAWLPGGVLGLARRIQAQEYLTVVGRVDYAVHPRRTRIVVGLERNEPFALAQEPGTARVTLENCVYLPYEDSVSLGHGPVKSLLITWGGPGKVDIVVGLRGGAQVRAVEMKRPPGVMIEAEGPERGPQSAGQGKADADMQRLQKEAEREEKEFLQGRRLAVQRVVIDPGHGGFDSGAVGPGGTKEKDIALQVAKRLRGKLERGGGIKVHLTREDDYFLDLSERTVITNQHRADLFVSIHCNASENRGAGGTETFSCSETASDGEAERVAALENAVARDREFFKDVPGFVGVEEILFRLERKLHWEESARLARAVQRLLSARLGIRDRGTKSARFYVLRKNHMPSVLAETAFISNSSEEELLLKEAFQEQVASCLEEAVRSAWAS